jgi:hypothetical protein
MPAHPTRRAITAGLATCAVALATAAPGIARPAGPGAAQGAVVATHGAHQRPGPVDLRAQAGVPTGSLAGTAESNLDSAVSGRPAHIASPDGGGTTTLAVLLIAGGAMFAGASAGFAGGRRGALRTH